MQVVLIDDNEIDIFVNQKLLETSGLGAEISTFSNPVSALKDLQGRDVDVIIVDNQMPELSGYDFLKKMLEAKNDLKSKMIVLTATVRQDLQDKYKALNPSIHLCEKPLDVGYLSALL
ncbi:MAG: response regulator [Bacteroidia bacterium]|nr:response regulator [Bacteroidia bacterium]